MTAHVPNEGTDGELQMMELLTTEDRDAVIAKFAAAGPVVRARHVDGGPVWLITGYDEIRTAFVDQRFRNDPSTSSGLDVTSDLPPDVKPYLLRTLGASDPPGHTRKRRLLATQFTARRIEKLRPRIAEIAKGYLNDVAAATAGAPESAEVDLMSQFAYPLPITVICELLGVPEEDRQRWQDWAHGLVSADPAHLGPSVRGLVQYLTELLEIKRADPRDDVLSGLIGVSDAEGRQYEDQELVAMALNLLVAGHETTAHLIVNGTLCLLANPDRAAALRADLGTIPAAVEELLRIGGPSDLTPRYPSEPVTLGGVTIPAGEPVIVMNAAGNRDAKRFDCPHEPVLNRPDNAHLAFGFGPHFCLGASLARAEGEIAFYGLLTRFPDLRLARPAETFTWERGFARRLATLPVITGQAAEAEDAPAYWTPTLQ
jgi:cytochrome P450